MGFIENHHHNRRSGGNLRYHGRLELSACRIFEIDEFIKNRAGMIRIDGEDN
jgi:hypothetical protein